MMLGEFQDTDINLDVIFNTEKFCGGSSGAGTHREKEHLLYYTRSKFTNTLTNALFAFCYSPHLTQACGPWWRLFVPPHQR